MTWQPLLDINGNVRGVKDEQSQRVVRWDGFGGTLTDWGQDNARLILAAQEMLQLLEVIKDIVPDSPYRDKINEVIAKVRGK